MTENIRWGNRYRSGSVERQESKGSKILIINKPWSLTRENLGNKRKDTLPWQKKLEILVDFGGGSDCLPRGRCRTSRLPTLVEWRQNSSLAEGMRREGLLEMARTSVLFLDYLLSDSWDLSPWSYLLLGSSSTALSFDCLDCMSSLSLY